MKFFIIFLGVVAAALALDISPEEEEKWQSFKLEHGKLFLSPGKEKTRKETFVKTSRVVDEHNEKFLRGEVAYAKKVNQWADIPDDVFMSQMAGTVKPADTRSVDQTKKITLRQTPPASVDLRGQAGVGEVRNQNPCGSCWAFCTAAAIEYAYWRKNGNVLDVSEQQMVDCCYPAGQDSCKGGWISTAMDYVSNNGGLLLEHQYPYSRPQISGRCQLDTLPQYFRFPKLTKPSHDLIAGDERSVKNALSQLGVLAICVDATDWRFDSVGIFTSPNAAGTLKCNHGVALVGYGTEGGIPYWLIRNSWGANFASNGYIRLDARVLANGNVRGGIFLDTAHFPRVE